MAQFKNTESGDVITVFGPLVPMYEAKAPVWERIDQPAPAGKSKRRASGPASQ